jgi:hypothetical protein
MNKRIIPQFVGAIVAIASGIAFGQTQAPDKSSVPDTLPAMKISQPLLRLALPGDKPLYFIATDGSDVLVQPGLYEVSLGKGNTIVLSPEDGDPMTIQAESTSHDEQLSDVTLLAEQTTQDDAHLLVLTPDGSALDALGTYSGTRQRGTRPRILGTSQIKRIRQTATLSPRPIRMTTQGAYTQMQAYQASRLTVPPCSDVIIQFATVVKNNRPTPNTVSVPGFTYYGSISKSGNTLYVSIPYAVFDVQNRGYLNRFIFQSENNILDVYHGALKFLTGDQAWNANYIKGSEAGKIVNFPTCFIRIHSTSGRDIGSESGNSTFYRSFTDDWPTHTGKDERYSLELWYFSRNSGLIKYADQTIQYVGCQPASDGKGCL